MRLAWAIVAGAVAAGVLAWWLAREDAPPSQAETAGTAAAAPGRAGTTPSAGPALYRWRDEAGVVQITDVPPKGREYTVVDVGALERRNIIDPNPAVTEAR